MAPFTITARWVFPVSGPPIEGGVITVRDGRIQAVEKSGTKRPDIDLGDVAILPGLVNAHTHLDLSGMRGMISTGQDFTHWLRAVIEHRRGLSLDQAIMDIRTGIAESVHNGVTLLGDISSQGLSWRYLSESPLRAVAFYELLGLPSDRAEKALTQAEDWLKGHEATQTCRPGLSPHAPYSVRSSLFEAASGLARKHRVPFAIHLAETLEEMELLEHRKGPFVPFLTELGVWDPDGLIHNPQEVIQQGISLSNFLVIHGNYLKLDTIRGSGNHVTVIYCPRTHAAFGHAPHPFRQILANGGRVALGTDSLASNPDLNILSEARFVHKLHPDFPGDLLLRMITLSGSEALGWDHETGSLAPGKSADLIVLPLPSGDSKDPHDRLFNSDSSISKVMWRGSWVYEADSLSRIGDTGSEETPVS
jgi:cytosine/adenosine deaminase-related metal-dependent hydrolase